MLTGSASEKIIIWGYVIVTLELILSPFFLIWRLRLLKWRHIFFAYFLSLGIFVGSVYFFICIDKYLYEKVYNSGWLMESLLEASRHQAILLTGVLVLLPFFITKIKYKRFNLKRFLLILLGSALTAIILLGAWAWFIGWSISQIGWLYF